MLQSLNLSMDDRLVEQAYEMKPAEYPTPHGFTKMEDWVVFEPADAHPPKSTNFPSDFSLSCRAPMSFFETQEEANMVTEDGN